MKTTLSFLFGFCFSIGVFAQSGFNYQALLKDLNGDPMPNTHVEVYIEYLEGTAQTLKYRELWDLNTNDNSVIAMVLGTGAADSGSF